MANGYIGKISALVTASTADLSRKLQGSASDIKRFSGSINAQFAAASRNAQASLNAIFTPLQRIERTLFAGRGLNLITEDQANKLRQAVSAAELINKPLAEAQRAFTGLSAEVSAGFLPALVRAQDQALLLNRRIQETGQASAKSFAIVEQSVQRTAAAVQRLAEAQNLLRSGPRGQELAFVAPEVSDTLRASAASRQQASELPAASRRAAAGQVANLAAVESRIAEVQAKIERARLRPRVDASELDDLQQKLAGYIAAAERIRQRIQIRIDTEQASKNLDELKAQLEQALTGRPANFDQVAAEYQRLRGEVEKLEVAQRQAFSAGLGELITLIASDDVVNLDRAKTLIDQIAAGLEGIKPAAPDRLSAASERLRERAERERQAADDREAELELQQGQRTDIPTGRQGRARVLDTLGGEIDVVARKVQNLPDALQSQFGPEVDRLTNKWRILARNGVGFAAEEADKLAAKAREITATLNSRQARGDQLLEAFGGAGEAGLNLGIDERSLRGIAGEFDFLQTKIAGVAAEARGPLVAAMENYRQVVTRAFRDGTISTQQGQAAIASARAEVVRLGADLTNTRPGRFAEQLNRAGDVARGFGAKLGLGLQQAIFAVDDFFSVTGGLDQQIRAAGNNISQLGFILGGTAGLIAGVSVSIGGQLAAAVIRYRNGLVAARDEAESLNATLRAQRDAVKEVADEFDQFINGIVDSAFSEATRKASEFTETLDGILERLKQIESESIASLDPTVIRERAIQQSLERRTGEARNVADILALQDAIERSRQREQAAANRAVERGPARQEDFAAITDTFVNRLNEALRASNDALGGFNLRNFLGRDSDESAFGLRGESLLGVVQPAIGSLIDLTGFGDDIRRAAGVQSRDRVNQLASVAEVTRLRVEAAGGDEQQLLAAISPLREELDRLLLSAGVADRGLVEFAQGVRLAITQVEASLASPEIREANKVFEEAARASRNVGSDLENIRKAADEAADAGIAAGRAISLSAEQLGREFKAASESLKAARAAGDPAAARVAAEELATVRVKIEAAAKEAAAVNIARQALDRFAAALDLASQEAQSNLQSAQQAADEARRADLGRSTPATRQARQQADADLARQRELATNVEEEVAAARERGRAGQSPAGLEASVRRIRGIDQLLSTQGVLASGQPEELARERARLEQQVVEADEQVRRARDASTREAEQAAAAVRGRELSRTDGERAAADLASGLEDIRQRFIRDFEDLAQPEVPLRFDAEGLAAAQQQFIDQRLRQEAPAIFGLADQVANAVLQGPSRAALEATDVSTVEGSRELNRLLRGDDSARDQNLVELQKQSEILTDMLQEIRQGGADVAN
jgi:hypothetical protein